MEIYLIRHTTPDVEKGTYYGQTDLALAASYEQDIRITRSKLPKDFGAIYSSPLTRCRTLARELKSSFFQTDDRLKEMNLGDWEMKRWDEIDPGPLENWTNNFDVVGPPNGESFQQLSDRVIPFFQEIVDSDFATVALVTHGGVIRSIINHLLEIPLKKSFTYTLDYGSVSLLDLPKPDLARVKYINR